MNLWELILIAIGVSMDAFAISICKGLSVEKLQPKHLLIVGIWFGGAQALMPLIGYYLGNSFYSIIQSIDHWVSFGLLVLIGANMIRESMGKVEILNSSFSIKAMLPLAIADSIDALAVGVTFAFQKVKILPAVFLIGVTTFMFSAIGIKIGNAFGAKYKSKAELAGGLVLILMGCAILIEDLGLIK